MTAGGKTGRISTISFSIAETLQLQRGFRFFMRKHTDAGKMNI